MTKIAFMFPGQGSFEAGMGRDVAEAVPEAMAVYDEGSEASGLDLKELCFHGPVEDLVHTEVQQPALVATSLALDAALRARGIRPDYVVGHSVGEFAALGSAQSLSAREAIALVRERGLAMAAAAKEHPGSMAAILGLADEAVEALCKKISNVWPANYNCPGQLVISGETPSVEEACVEAEREGARRAIRLRVSGAFHSPLVGARGRPAAPGDREGAPDRGPRGVHVDGDREDRGRPAVRRAARRAADRARPVHAGRARARRPGCDDVRRGRARQRAQRFTEEDRHAAFVCSPSTTSSRSTRRRRRLASDSFASLEGKTALVTGASRGSAARSRRSWRAPARPSSSATARARTRPRQLATAIGGRAVQADVSTSRRRAPARRGGGRRRRARQQRRPDARRPARADVRRRLATP